MDFNYCINTGPSAVMYHSDTGVPRAYWRQEEEEGIHGHSLILSDKYFYK